MMTGPPVGWPWATEAAGRGIEPGFDAACRSLSVSVLDAHGSEASAGHSLEFILEKWVAAAAPAFGSTRKHEELTAMIDWRAMTQVETRNYFLEFAKKIRSRELFLGKDTYALPLAHGVWQAMHCGYEGLAAVELGVHTGVGLLSLFQAAEFFRAEFGLDIRVYGFDRGTGLPALTGDHRDHPELFYEGEFPMPDEQALRASLPEWCELIIGDVGETIPWFLQRLRDRRLAFAAFDLDLYSSTTRALPLLAGVPELYLPAVPLYFDDTAEGISHCDWAGERLAVLEFNEMHALRKISWPLESRYRIRNFFVLQVLDHPIRQGKVRPRYSFQLGLI